MRNNIRTVELRVALFACLIVFLVLASPANAQILYGSLVGNVTDSSGAAIPGANVKITNTDNGQEWNLTTNEVGIYTLQSVNPGTYSVTVSAQGFKPFTKTDILLRAGDTVRADATLTIGPVTESVVVSAQQVVLQTDTVDVRDEVQTKELEDIPAAIDRNYQSLLVTMPGFLPPDSAGTNFNAPGSQVSYSPNGTNSYQVTYANDGAVSRHGWFQGQPDYVPTIEAIESVSVSSGTHDAEQGYAGTTAVKVQMKSGTNEMHGSAFWFHNNQHLKARPYFSAPGDNPKNIVNQAGGTIGGPIKKNKLFYFGSYEGTFDRASQFSIATVPTAAMRAGDLSDSSTTIYDPMSAGPGGKNRDPFPGNVIPGNRISPVAQKVIDLIPPVNYGVPGASVNNYYASGPRSFDRSKVDAKLTWNAHDKLTVNARFGFLYFNGHGPTRYGRLEGNKIGNKSGYSGTWDGWQTSQTYSAVYTVTPNVVIDGYFALSAKKLDALPPFLDENLGRDFLGIPGTNGPNTDYGGWPRLQISGYTNFGRGSNSQPSTDQSNSNQLAGNLAWIKGKHNLRFGGDFIRMVLERYEPKGHPGQFYFKNGVTQLKGQKASQFNGWASFLLGLPQEIGKMGIWESANSVSPTYSLYARDRWQATRRLTVTLGLRWEYYPPPTRLRGKGFPIYNTATNEMTLCGWGSISVDACGFHSNKRGFAPNVGLAYRLTDSFVMRAGYAISWDPSNVARDSAKWFPASTRWALAGDSSYDYASSIEDGLPEINPPDIGNGVIDLPHNFEIGMFDRDFRRQYIQSWNLMLEKNFGGGWVGEIGYVANRGRGLPARWDFNYSTIGGGNKSRVLYAPFGHTSRMRITTNLGMNSQFDSLQSSLQKRFSHGYMLRLTYTWRRAFFDRFQGYPNPLYWYMGKHNPNSTDVPHGLAASFAAELPFGRAKKWANRGVGAALLGGWQVNGLLSCFQGRRFPVTASGSSLNAPGHTQHADQVKPKVEVYGDPNMWFDPLAYAPVTEPRFGNSGYNQLRGPGYVNLDLSVFRTFKLTERFNLQFRAEAYNATNTPHFNNPGHNINNLRLNPDGTIKNLNGFAQVTKVKGSMRDGIDERMFKFAIRLTF